MVVRDMILGNMTLYDIGNFIFTVVILSFISTGVVFASLLILAFVDELKKQDD